MTSKHTPATRGKYGARTDILDRLEAAHATRHLQRIPTNVLFTDAMREIRALREHRDAMLEALKAAYLVVEAAAAECSATNIPARLGALAQSWAQDRDKIAAAIAKATGGDDAR